MDRKDHWGVVVVQEDSYIPRYLYYEKARAILNLEEESQEWRWVVKHIKVTSLYEVQKISLSGYSILNACKECFDTDPFAYPFSGFLKKGFKWINKNSIEFTKQHNKKIDGIIGK